MLLWTGQTNSEIGSRITREGLPLTAVLVLAATPAQMGVLAFLGGIATLVIGPLAGMAADRYRLRPILIAADLGRAALLGLIPLLATASALRLWHLYALAAAAAVLTVFFDVGYQSLLPSLVRRDQLLEGNNKLTLSATTAEIVGPGMTGFLIQALSAPRAILLDALSFVASALSLAFIRRPEHKPARPEHEPMLAELTAGFRHLAGDPLLRPLALRTAGFSLSMGTFAALYVLYAISVLRLRPAVLGLVIAVGGVSAFAGALIAQRLGRRFPLGGILIACAAGHGATALLVPLARPPAAAAALLLGASQLGDLAYSVYAIHELTLRQSIVPGALLGRVNAAMQMLFRGLLPIGSLAGGILASATSVRFALLLSALGALASVLFLIVSPVRRLRAFPVARTSS